MKTLTLIPNKEGTGFACPSEYNRLILKDWIKKYKFFSVVPKIRASRQQQKYLEGAVIPAYCQYQYETDPRKPENKELMRTLFKQDFNSKVIKDRNGEPRRVALSLAKEHGPALDKYVKWAEENGGPVPNEALYKLWRDEFSMEVKYNNYWDWLEGVGLSVDSMPSKETIDKLRE